MALRPILQISGIYMTYDGEPATPEEITDFTNRHEELKRQMATREYQEAAKFAQLKAKREPLAREYFDDPEWDYDGEEWLKWQLSTSLFDSDIDKKKINDNNETIKKLREKFPDIADEILAMYIDGEHDT